MAESPVMASPTSGLPPPRPASFFGRQTAVIPEFNDGRLVGSHSRPTMSRASSVPSLTDKTSATSEDDLLGSTESGGAHKSLRRIRSSYDMNAGSSHSHASSSEEAKAVLPDDDLQGFADRFRSLVSQVSRELEEGLQLEPDDDIAAPRTPPIHHVLDTHIPYASLDEFGRPMHDERIAVLGGVVRRMPTIESVGSRELMSIRSGLPNGLNSPTTTSSMSSRPPTRATMLSLSDGASAPPSRSNSLHAAAAPPRMASELGELAREPTTSSSRSSVRGSTGTSYYTMPPGSSSTRSSEGLAGAPRSRSNSLGATEVLSPVTELGELGREDDVLGSRLSAALEEYYTAPTGGRAQAGMAEVSELGELGRAEDGSAPGSATSSTGFYSATSASTMDSASKPDS
ncbi:hypothetical protein BV25DRAFT_489065 [Artomyces pyxidatus]|uniref:Uncharacterized protein n=1 Tax=Artomyces pyxidatus TaxID=48021 RepID=A0ACB8T4Q9_9AGAM|nr:hypothetical protein BV25DRAFT_489065 [Artomyces pyxidatus]